MTAQELVELRSVIEKADEKCKLLDELKKVEYKPIYVEVTVNGYRPIEADLAKRIFEAGIKALRGTIESELEQLQINRPKDNEPSAPVTITTPGGTVVTQMKVPYDPVVPAKKQEGANDYGGAYGN